MASFLAAVGSIVLMLAGYAVPEAISAYSNRTKKRLTEIGRAIYNKMSKNQKFMDQLYDAYTNNRNALQSLLFTGSGFGPRMHAIYREIEAETARYKQQKDEATKEQAKLTNDYNEVSNAQVQAGSGLVASIAANEVADKMNQYVEGGLKENAT